MDNISQQNGIVEMAYTGAIPWHQLGNRIAMHMTAHEALIAAHLTWKVDTKELTWGNNNPVPSHQAIVRQDTSAVLGVVSKQYTPIQNQEAAEMLDIVVDEGAAMIEVAGALGQGEKCWMLAKLPEKFEVVDGDQIDSYVLLAWGHDGKTGLAMTLTPVRVVCQNTLYAALGSNWSKSADVYVKHIGNVELAVNEVREKLGLVKKQINTTRLIYQTLAQYQIPDSTRDAYFTDLFPGPDAKTLAKMDNPENSMKRWEQRQENLAGLFYRGKGVHFAPGSAWAAYNAVTEYVDHVYPVTQNGSVSQSRQSSAIFGSYSNVKKRALKLAAEIAGIPA